MGAAMKRRDFILGLGGAALCLNAARGQQNPPIIQHSTTKKRIAQVVPSTKVDEMKADPVTKPFFDELKRLGYVEGENLIPAQGSYEHDSDCHHHWRSYSFWNRIKYCAAGGQHHGRQR